MGGRRIWWRLAAGASMLLIVGAVAVGVALSSSGGSATATRATATSSDVTTTTADPDPVNARAARSDPPVTIALSGRAAGRPIASGFLGFSFEFQAVRAYTGDDPDHINPVLLTLIRNLTPGQAPVLRIGGNSTDVSWAPGPGVRPPGYVGYELTPGWMATTGALAKQLGARMIMGLNLAANEPSLAATEARDYVAAFGRGAIEAFEIGNEPNIYGKITTYHTALGVPVKARPRSFGYPAFRSQFTAVADLAPQLALAGPALAIGPKPGKGSWVHVLGDFLRRLPRVSTMTVHRYPLRSCYVPPRSPQYPSIEHLLSSYATVSLASSLKPWLKIAAAAHRPLRVDELNSVACRGKAGVSDTFASALWATDALFTLARAGVAGVNLHTLPGAAYQLFQFSQQGSTWSGAVSPVYYGLELFAQAAPAGSRLLELTRHGPDTGLSAWATRARDRTVRVVLINKSTSQNRTVKIREPAGSRAGATVERLLAPSVTATHGVTLGGHSYGASTTTGRLPGPEVAALTARHGTVTLSVPRGSAAMVTLGG
jgi:hypothetical protein